MNNVFREYSKFSFDEMDKQFAEYHTSSLDCKCGATVVDNYLVHNWVNGDD